MTTRISCSMSSTVMPEVAAQLAEEVGHLERLGRVHAGRRFVEQQQARLVGQGAGDLQPALVAVRQLHRQAVAATLEPHEVEQAERLDVGLLLLVALGRRAHDRAEPGRVEVVVLADEDVLDRGHAREQADVLVRPRDAVVGDLVRAQRVDRVAIERDAALVHVEEAGQAVEERRLAGAVRPDDARDRAFLEFEVELADGGQAAEPLGDLVGLQQGGHRGASGSESMRCRVLVHRGRRPSAAPPRRPRRPRPRPPRRRPPCRSAAAPRRGSRAAPRRVCSSRRATLVGSRPSGRRIMIAIRAMP